MEEKSHYYEEITCSNASQKRKSFFKQHANGMFIVDVKVIWILFQITA